MLWLVVLLSDFSIVSETIAIQADCTFQQRVTLKWGLNFIISSGFFLVALNENILNF
jgi:hypothetical protein